MTDSINVLAKELAKAIPSKSKTSPYDTQAVVKRIDGDIAWVHIPGGVDETPVQLTTNAKKGDIVQVRVSGGRAWLYGNSTNPPTDDTKANEVGKKLLKTETEIYETIIHTEKEIYKEIAADRAEVGELIAGKADIDDLTAATARIEDLEADHVSVTDFKAEQANIDNLQAATADIDTIRANSAKVQNLTAAQLEADHATIGSLDTNYAQINLANVNNAWIENGLVKNAAIGDAQISGVSANKLTAGTIDASNITVTNLNADNITAGTLNGQRIGNGSLSLDKLSEAVYTESEVDDKLDDMQKEIDGAIETYTGTVVPTLNNTPASSWNTTALKDKHVGDVYYVVNNSSNQNGYCYRFTKSGSTYSWVLIKDSDVTAALQRLTEAEGDISGLQQFESTTSSWISNTDIELNSLKTRTTNVETSLGDKVDISTFNELSQTVDENSSSITSLTTTVQSKADSSTVTTLSNTVNNVKQTADTNSSKITKLTTTLGTNADGTTKAGDVMHQVSDVTQDLSGFKTTVSQTYQTKDDMSNYSTTSQMNSAISQSASGIMTTVSSTYATQTALSDVEDSIPTNVSDLTNDTGFITDADVPTKVSELQNDSNFATQTYADGKASAAQQAAIADAQKKLASQYAISSTAAGTDAKVATITPAVTGWSLYNGASITVKFTNANTTTAPTLNVNSTGAKRIYLHTGTTALTEDVYKWPAGTTMDFFYDGSYWRIQDATELTRIKTAETNITQNSEQIQLKASQNDLNSLTGRVSNAESTITQQATAIEAKVSKDGVIASINASVEQQGGSAVTINANKVNISGVITAINNDSTTTIDGGKITANTISVGKIDASSGTFATANIPNLDAGKITTGSLSADVIKGNVISAINSLTAGQINGARINAGQLTIGQTQVTGLTGDLDGKASTDAAWTVSIEVSSIDYLTPTATLVAKPYYYGTLTTTGITYQWSKNGTNISGATNSTYTTSDLNAAYTCTIS